MLGIWAHRQALAARDAGVDVRVAVLYRPIPPRAEMTLDAARRALAQPPRAVLDGLHVDYVPFVSPPRGRSYGTWGAWATPSLAVYLRTGARRFSPHLVHAHNAVPAGEAVRRAGARRYVVSVHGGDVFHTAPRHGCGRAGGARDARSRADRDRQFAAASPEAAWSSAHVLSTVVHLGTDLPEPGRPGATHACLRSRT